MPPLILSQDQTWPYFSLISGRDFFKGEGCNTPGVNPCYLCIKHVKNLSWAIAYTYMCIWIHLDQRKKPKFAKCWNTIREAMFRDLNFFLNLEGIGPNFFNQSCRSYFKLQSLYWPKFECSLRFEWIVELKIVEIKHHNWTPSFSLKTRISVRNISKSSKN